MNIQHITAPDAYDFNTGYAQAVSVSGNSRTLYVSGQTPLRPDGSLPEAFTDQAR